MSVDTIRRIISKVWIKSKKFFWDFRAELLLSIAAIEVGCEKSVSEIYSLDSIISKLNEIKIRIDDPDHHIDIIVTIILRYNNDDEKYGHVHVEIVFSGMSKKPKSDFLGSYLVTDRMKLTKDITKHLMRRLSHIY